MAEKKDKKAHTKTAPESAVSMFYVPLDFVRFQNVVILLVYGVPFHAVIVIFSKSAHISSFIIFSRFKIHKSKK